MEGLSNFLLLVQQWSLQCARAEAVGRAVVHGRDPSCMVTHLSLGCSAPLFCDMSNDSIALSNTTHKEGVKG
jgi:hypothetical protein